MHGWTSSSGLVERIFNSPSPQEGAATPAMIPIVASALSLAGLIVGLVFYGGNLARVHSMAVLLGPVRGFFVRGWYIDELYERLLIRPVMKLGLIFSWFDDHVLDQYAVEGPAWLVRHAAKYSIFLDDRVLDGALDAKGNVVSDFGALARRLQNGFGRRSFLVVTAGLLALWFWRIFS